MHPGKVPRSNANSRINRVAFLAIEPYWGNISDLQHQFTKTGNATLWKDCANELGWLDCGILGVHCGVSSCGSFNKTIPNFPGFTRWATVATPERFARPSSCSRCWRSSRYLSCCLISTLLYLIRILHIFISLLPILCAFSSGHTSEIFWICFPSGCVPIWCLDIHLDRKHEGTICNNWHIALNHIAAN